MSFTKYSLLLYTVHCTHLHKPQISLFLQLSCKTMAESHINYRMIEAGREVIWSNFLLNQDHPRPVVQVCVWTAFEYFQGWRLHNLSRQLVARLSYLHSEKMFPCVQLLFLFPQYGNEAKLNWTLLNMISYIFFFIIQFPFSSFRLY